VKHGSSDIVHQSSVSPSLVPPSVVVVKDYQLLAIVLPVAVATVLIVVGVVSVGVIICVRDKRDNGWK